MAQTIVVLRKGRDHAAFMRELRKLNLAWRPVGGLARHFVIDGVAPVDFPLRDHPAVELVGDGDAPVHVSSQSLSITSDLSGGSWGLARVVRRRAPWNVNWLRHPIETFYRAERDGTGVDYYSIDSGVRTDHDELNGRVTNVYEYYSSGGAGDDQGHGTATASASCGLTLGAARGALAWSFKCISSSSSGTNTALVTALGQALSHYSGRSATDRPAVVNLSLGGFGSAVASAVSDLIDAGMVVVAAAGNSGSDLGSVDEYPAEVDDAIVVGGISMTDQPYDLNGFATNYGTRVDILAPSQQMPVADYTGTSLSRIGNGTSFGCAYTSGVIACMLQGRSRLANRTAVQALRAELIANATTGRFRPMVDLSPLPDAILYLDPDSEA